MVRLTVRSGRDGRFLARVIDPGGYPFVLDFGDHRVIDDAQQRLLHGFTMWRHGQLVAVAPREPEMLAMLAEYYVSQGLLVAFEEPSRCGRAARFDGLSDAVDRSADSVSAQEVEDEITDIVER